MTVVRIATEGQFRLPDPDLARLNELDNEAVQAVEAGDEARFCDTLARMIELVRTDGEPLADDDIVESDIIIPPADTTLAEAGEEFTGDGLIPD